MNIEKPWNNEPNFAKWIHPSGLRCLVFRGPLGALNGYVRVPKSKLRKRLINRQRKIQHFAGRFEWLSRHMHYTAYDSGALSSIDVHGGLTFSGRIRCNGCNPITKKREFWIGFDCAHSNDMVPKMVDFFDKGKTTIRPEGVYRNFAYVTKEVNSLAEQLAQILERHK